MIKIIFCTSKVIIKCTGFRSTSIITQNYLNGRIMILVLQAQDRYVILNILVKRHNKYGEFEQHMENMQNYHIEEKVSRLRLYKMRILKYYVENKALLETRK